VEWRDLFDGADPIGSYLNCPWIYAPEINSLKMRSAGAAMASASNWLCKCRS